MVYQEKRGTKAYTFKSASELILCLTLKQSMWKKAYFRPLGVVKRKGVRRHAC